MIDDGASKVVLGKYYQNEQIVVIMVVLSIVNGNEKGIWSGLLGRLAFL